MKNIYKDFNNIEVDINEINSINVELDDIAKQRVKNNVKKLIASHNTKYKYKFIGLAMGCLVCLIFVFTIKFQNSNPTFAENIPILNSIFEKFNDRYEGNFKDYTQVIGESKTYTGYTITLNEVVIDDYSLIIAYTIKSTEKVSKLIEQSSFPYIPETQIIMINKDSLIAGGGGSHKVIDDYTIQVFMDYNLNNINIPNNFNMKIDFGDINNIQGNRNFEFYVSKDKISKDIKTFSPNNQIKIPVKDNKEAILNFEKVSFSPISTAILIKSNRDFEYGNLIFKDENGNIIKSYQSSLRGNILGYTALYKFKYFEKIPKKIIVEYPEENTKTTIKTELVLK